MQSSASKKARFNPALEPSQTPTFIKSFLPDLGFSGLSSVASFFPSSPPLILQPTNLLSSPSRFPPKIPSALDRQQSRQTVRQSSPIGSEGPFNLLLAACQRAEKEAKAEKRGNSLSLESSDMDEEETVPPTAFLEDDLSESDNSTSKEENEWENEDDEREQECFSYWIDLGNTSYAKEKFIRILAGDIVKGAASRTVS